MTTLPIYRIATSPNSLFNNFKLDDLAKRLFEIGNYSMQEINGRSILQSSNHLIDVDKKNGVVWAVDQTDLWNPKLYPHLPNKQKVSKIADEFIMKNNLLPQVAEEDNHFAIEMLEPAGSFVSTMNRIDGEREDRQLDYRIQYSFQMILDKDPENENGKDSDIPVPVIGPGAKMGVTIGDEGKIIAYNSSWQPLESIETNADYIPRIIADKYFRKLTEKLNLESFDATLAYTFTKSLNKQQQQQYLYPVWTYRGICNIEDHKLPLRIITIPATEFGPTPRNYEHQSIRSKQYTPLSWNWKTGKKRGLTSINPYEASTSWIGQIGGLGGSRNNAQGFINELKDAGWNINFNWGDCNAWKTDWARNDDNYVDASDFVFYTGHAGVDGWQLINPDDCSPNYLTPAAIGNSPEVPGDRWGQQDLEWIIIAACGPLEDDILAKDGGNALNRWDGIFGGLHTLMGYGAVTFDNEEEGQRIVQYAREGQTLINAWFRMAQEIQPSDNGYEAPYGPTVYVGALWAGNDRQQEDPFNDHLWGYGSVAADPVDPDYISCMWVPC
jgi:hypothetical protein